MSDEFQKHYELQGPIGEGGLTTVYKVRHLDSSSFFAFKKLKDNSPINLDALKNEYMFLNSCRHPGIVAIVDFVQDNKQCGLISELVEGRPLQEFCGRLNDIELHSALVEMFEIGVFIHYSGYIYNDFKPQNFIRRPDNTLKLVDFNLVQKKDAAVSNNCGTLQYLAPEIVRGGQISNASDIYSLSVTIYELITGHLPFIAADQDSLIKAIAELPPLPLTGKFAHWNPAIQQLLAKNPADRPGSFFEAARLFGLSSNLETAIKYNAEYYLRFGDLDHLELPASKDSLSHILNTILKKHSLDDEYLTCLYDWAGNNTEIIHQYLLYLVANDFIKFTARGWVSVKPVESSILPNAVRDNYLYKMLTLTSREFDILSWIAIANRSLTNDDLSQISDSCMEHVKTCVARLDKYGLIIREKEKCRVINKSLALTVATQLQPARLSQIHRRVAEFLTIREPDNHALLAEHYAKIPDHKQTIEYGYQAATEFLRDDNLNQTRRYLELALDAKSALPEMQIEPNRLARLYLFAGDFAKRMVDNRGAEKYYQDAARYAEFSGDRKMLAIIHKNLGDLYRRDQRSAESIEFSQKALDSFRKLGERSLEAACLNNISLAHWLNGNYATALEFLDSALKINEELGDLLEQSKIHSNIGFISDLVGNTGQVLRSFDKALDCARKVGDYYQEMVGLNNIGFFYLNSGNPAQALTYFHQALDIALKRNYIDQQLNMESNIAWAYHEMGNIIKSAEANQKTLDIALKNRHELFAAQSSYLSARDCLVMGNYRLADRMLIQARKICSEISNNDLAIDILLGQIELALATGDLIRTGQLLDDFSAEKNPSKKQLLTGKLYQARLLELMRDESALALYKSIIAEVTENEFSDIAINAAIAGAEICLGQNQIEPAHLFIDGLDTQNVLTKLRLMLVTADMDNASRKFDNALESLRAIKKRAESYGCLPEYFRACLVETDIYLKCGKINNAIKTIAKIDKMYQSLQKSFPEDRQTANLGNLPFIDRYLKMRAACADRPTAVRIR
jgi:serine/threonine protein kinase/tetratricopeptide (TPR) repeat protein